MSLKLVDVLKIGCPSTDRFHPVEGRTETHLETCRESPAATAVDLAPAATLPIQLPAGEQIAGFLQVNIILISDQPDFQRVIE